MKFSKICAFLSLVIIVGCNEKSSSPNTESITETSAVLEIASGNYGVPCFENKAASQGFGSTVYSTARMTLNNDGTGSNDYEIFDDVGCTNLVASGTVQLLHHESVLVDGEHVLLMDQDDGNGVMRIWIPYKILNGSIYFDLDFSDGESGPYMAEPTAAEIFQFMTDPSDQGVLVQ